MNIAHVITRMILGGAQENTLLTCQGLHRHGHEVTLVTGPALGPEGQLMDRARAGGYRVIEIDSLRREIHPRDATAYRAMRRVLGDLRPDVVHTHSSKAGILGRFAGPARAKVVHTIHGLPFHPYQSRWRNGLYAWLERQAARRTDVILSVADAMTRQALAAGVGQPGQYTTVYSGMEVEPFLTPTDASAEFRASLDLPEGAVLVTQVSRLAELKGHDFLLDAAERVDGRVCFCLVGDGHLREKIERDLDRRGLRSRFRLTGLLDPSRIPAVMQATDVLVHCSLREGLARTLPQAMLAGTPAVCFDVDGAAEVVDDETGVLVCPGDAVGLAAGIDRLAGDADLRARLGRAGQNRCRERFDWRTMVRQIEEVYENMVLPETCGSPAPG